MGNINRCRRSAEGFVPWRCGTVHLKRTRMVPFGNSTIREFLARGSYFGPGMLPGRFAVQVVKLLGNDNVMYVGNGIR